MSKARSLADLISGNAVIEASEIANGTISGDKLASDISISTTSTASLATSGTDVNKLSIGTGHFENGTLRVTDTTNGGSVTIRGLGPQLKFDASGNYTGGTGSSNNKPTIMMDGRGLVFRQGMEDACNPTLYIHCNNNIGINTDSPTYTLHSLGSGTDGAFAVFHGKGSNYSGIQIASDSELGGGNSDTNLLMTRWNGTSTCVGAVKIGVTTNNNDGVLTFSTAENAALGSSSYTERMRIDGDTGNIGIGTTSPTQDLDILNASGSNIVLRDTSSRALVMCGPATGVSPRIGTTGTSSSLIVTMNSNDCFVFTASGCLGVNTTNPLFGLHMCNGTIGFDDGTTIRHRIKSIGHQIGLGRCTLQAASADCGNLAFGSGALQCNDVGQYNVAMGYQALYNNNSAAGSYNTAHGYQALYSNTTGEKNTAVGYHSMYSNTTGECNTAIGISSLRYNTTGYCNVAVGHLSLEQNTTGLDNVVIGSGAARCNTTASQHVVIGTMALGCNATGIENIAIGSRAMCANVTGSCNTAIGRSALRNNNANRNTAVGYQAMVTNTTGFNNSAFGDRSMLSNTTGSFNTAIGAVTLFCNTIGCDNVAVGNYSLQNNTTGKHNIAVGRATLYLNTTGTHNTAVGNSALAANTIGSGNTGIGSSALRCNTTANYNTAIGYQSMFNTTTGERNTAVGMFSLLSNTTGICNIAIGICALRFNTIGTKNVAIGAISLYCNTTGTVNVAIGDGALFNNTTGSRNVAVGTRSLESHTGEGYNTALGACTLRTTTTANHNIAVGFQALELNTTGNLNVAVGSFAGKNTSTGVESVFIGYTAGNANTTGNYNTAIGSRALCANTTGHSNTVIGYGTGCTITTGSNLTAVGYNAEPSSATATNEITLGNSSINCFRIPGLTIHANSTGGFGIGTTSPSEKLDVRGDTFMCVGPGNKGLTMIPSAAGSTSILLNTFADNTSGRNWAIRNRYNAHGRLEIMRGTTNTDSPLTTVLRLDNDSSATFTGSLSKASGSFKIDHPLPSKTETHNLVHSFVEAPQADNIYRGKIDLVNGTATVNIDTNSGMSDGTFVLLNREIQVFTSNETGWTAVKGSVSGNILTITAQDNTCTDTISWLVIGERQDQHMYNTNWTDENGKVIVEPLKETEETLEGN